MTKLGLLCDRVIEIGWLAAAVTVPLYFNIYSSRVFEPDKLIALRCIVLLMALAFFVRLVEQGVSLPSTGDRMNPISAIWRTVRSDNPLAIPTLVFCGAVILSTVASVSPGVSVWGSYQRLQGTYTTLTYIALFFLVAHGLRTRAQLNRLITVILLTSLPVSFYGIAQHQKMDPLPWAGDVTGRVASTMGNAIFLAAYLIMVVPLTATRLLDSLGRLRSQSIPDSPRSLRFVLTPLALVTLQNAILALFAANAIKSPNLWWGALGAVGMFLNLALFFQVPRPTRLTVWAEVAGYSALLAMQLVAIFLTQSRGPWLGLGVGLFVFVALLAIRNRSTPLLKYSSAVALALIVLLILYNIPNGPLAGYRSLPYVGRLGSIFETEGGTGKVRLLIWQGAWNLFLAHPSIGLQPDGLSALRPLIGYGPETMYVAFNKVYPPELAHFEARNATPDRAHMAILDFLVTTGVFGLAAFALVLVAAWRTAWKALWGAEQPYYHLVLTGVVAAIAAHLVESQFGIPIASTLTHLWLFLGMIAAIGVMQLSESARGDGVAVEAHDGSSVMESKVHLSGKGRVPGPAAETEGRPRKIEPRIEARAKTKAKAQVSRSTVLRPEPLQLTRRRITSAVSLSEDTSGPEPTGRHIAALYVSLSALTMFLLTRLAPIDDVQQPFIGGFLWLMVGIIAAAMTLGADTGGGAWRIRQYWAHAPAAVLVALAIGLNLNVVAADIYYKRGFSFESQRQWIASVQAYQEAITLAPTQDFYYLFLGRVYLELAKSSNQPKLVPPLNIDLDFVKSAQPGTLQRLGREDLLEASRVALEEAYKLAPLNTDHTANLARLYRFWGATNTSKLELATRYYSAAVRISPQAAHLWDEWAEVYLSTGQFDKALERLEIARRLDEQFPLTYLYLGDTYIGMRRPNEALDAHAQVLKLNPGMLSDQRLEHRINFYLEWQLADRLVPLYSAAAETFPQSAPVRSAFGYLLSKLGRIEEGAREFEARVRITPEDWIARRNLALSYEALGKVESAIREAEESRNLAPADQKEALGQWIAQLKLEK